MTCAAYSYEPKYIRRLNFEVQISNFKNLKTTDGQRVSPLSPVGETPMRVTERTTKHQLYLVYLWCSAPSRTVQHSSEGTDRAVQST